MTHALNIAKTQLAALGPQRVWSLLVTVFGDLAQNKGDGIEGPVLSVLMHDLQIKPEALRVALHRLRNEDWITSTKTGRTSLHSLTQRGHAESAKASPRIYGSPAQMPDTWQVIVLENTGSDRAALLQQGFAPLLPRVYIGASDTVAPKDALVLSAGTLPTWMKDQFEPPELATEYATLHTALTALNQTIQNVPPQSARDIAVLRCLIVHSWRRLVLRHPALPRALYSKGWKGHACRALVTDLLAQLPKPNLAEITRD